MSKTVYLVAVVGADQVGKSTLVQNLLNQSLPPQQQQTNFVPTLPCESDLLRISGLPGKVGPISVDSRTDVYLYDTTRLHEFVALRDAFYKHMDGFICVYDLRNKDSFNKEQRRMYDKDVGVINMLEDASFKRTEEAGGVLIATHQDKAKLTAKQLEPFKTKGMELVMDTFVVDLTKPKKLQPILKALIKSISSAKTNVGPKRGVSWVKLVQGSVTSISTSVSNSEALATEAHEILGQNFPRSFEGEPFGVVPSTVKPLSVFYAKRFLTNMNRVLTAVGQCEIMHGILFYVSRPRQANPIQVIEYGTSGVSSEKYIGTFPRNTIYVGQTQRTMHDIDEFVEGTQGPFGPNQWTADSYDQISNNCNDFCNALVKWMIPTLPHTVVDMYCQQRCVFTGCIRRKKT